MLKIGQLYKLIDINAVNFWLEQKYSLGYTFVSRSPDTVNTDDVFLILKIFEENNIDRVAIISKTGIWYLRSHWKLIKLDGVLKII